jgi:hypothetical protein
LVTTTALRVTLKIGKLLGEMVAERAKLDIDLDLVPAIATKVDAHFEANPLPAEGATQ